VSDQAVRRGEDDDRETTGGRDHERPIARLGGVECRWSAVSDPRRFAALAALIFGTGHVGPPPFDDTESGGPWGCPNPR
jgi:hypothetical protein